MNKNIKGEILKSLTTVVFLIIYSYISLNYWSFGNLIMICLVVIFLYLFYMKFIELLGSGGSSNLEYFDNNFFKYLPVFPPVLTFLRLITWMLNNISSHRSLSLCLIFFNLFSLCASIWIVYIAMFSNSLEFSSVVYDLLLIPFNEYFILYIIFLIWRCSIWFFLKFHLFPHYIHVFLKKYFSIFINA